MASFSRREVLGFMAAGGATTLLQGHGALAKTIRGQTPPSSAAPATLRAMVPLPFMPSKLKGISEKLIVSHHQNNYGGAVKNLNVVRGQIAGLPKDSAGFLVGGLRAKELAYAVLAD